MDDTAVIRIEPLTAADVPAAAAMYAAAFADNPLYASFLFRALPAEGPARVEAREWLFAKRLHVLLEAGALLFKAVAVTSHHGEDAAPVLVGAVGATPPHARPSLWTQVRHGLLGWPLWWGWASFRAALAADSLLGHVPADDEDWTVNMMAVLPSYQGRRVGSRLLQRLLTAIAAANGDMTPAAAGARVRLDTQAPGNVLFYAREGGFALVSRRRVDPVARQVLCVVDARGNAAAAATEMAAAAATAAAAGRRCPLHDDAPFDSWTMARLVN
jgi:GNAT superfamily N-acetyltransferase